MDEPPKYRGPPPRKDLVQSPSRERDWKGNDVFAIQTEITMSDERQERPSTAQSDFNVMPSMNGEYHDPHLKSARDYGSDYSKLAMQGGHKDLLSINGADDELDSQRRQKSCDNLSEYNQVAKQGGQKDLLSMRGEQEEMGRKQKGCENISDYNRMALEGGHKDLLVIEENKRSNRKVEYTRTGGDWFAHDAPKKYAPPQPESNGVEEQRSYTNGNGHQYHPAHDKAVPSPKVERQDRNSSSNNSSCILPGNEQGNEQGHRTGRKRFDQSSQRRDAPFATFF